MKKLYIIVVFSIITSINCMERIAPELDYDTLAKTAEFLIAMNAITDLAMPGDKENTSSESNTSAEAATTSTDNALRQTITRPFPCPHCSKGFARPDNRNQHAITCKHNPHPDQEALTKFKCPHSGCTHTSRRKSDIKQHTITCPYNQRPNKEALTRFKCLHCNQGFSTSSVRNRHTITCEHNKNSDQEARTRFKCSYCGKGFFQSNDRKRHASRCRYKINQKHAVRQLDDFNKSSDLSAGLRPAKRHHAAACSSHES